jgi:hypothetical protein
MGVHARVYHGGFCHKMFTILTFAPVLRVEVPVIGFQYGDFIIILQLLSGFIYSVVWRPSFILLYLKQPSAFPKHRCFAALVHHPRHLPDDIHTSLTDHRIL